MIEIDIVAIPRERGRCEQATSVAHDEAAIARAFAAGVSAFTTDRPDLAIALRP